MNTAAWLSSVGPSKLRKRSVGEGTREPYSRCLISHTCPSPFLSRDRDAAGSPAVPVKGRCFASTTPVQRWEGSKFSLIQTAPSGHWIVTTYPSTSLLFPNPSCHCHATTASQAPTCGPIFKDHSAVLNIRSTRGPPQAAP